MSDFTPFERSYLEFLRRRFEGYRGLHDEPIMDDPLLRVAVETFGVEVAEREVPEVAFNCQERLDARRRWWDDA